jgi:hypothetical protein
VAEVLLGYGVVGLTVVGSHARSRG